MFGFIKNLFKRHKWAARYMMKIDFPSWSYPGGAPVPGKEGAVVCYLEENEVGDRRVLRVPLGECKTNQNWKINSKTEAAFDLWVRTGIIPTGAESLIMKKLQA